MYGFKTQAGKSIESKAQLLQVKHDEIVTLTVEQAINFGVQNVRTIKDSSTIRAGVLKEQACRMNASRIAKLEQAESEQRAEIFAIASMNQNCFVGSDC